MSVIHLRKGDALTLRFSATDDATGEPYPMSGWTGEASMSFSNCPAIDFTFEWVSIGAGVAKGKITKEQSAQLQHVGDYLMQARFISPDGDPISTNPVTIRVRD